MERLLELMREDARRTPAQLASMLGEEEASVRERIAKYEADGAIRGYQAIVNPDLVEENAVHAVIELRISPTQERGFDKIAGRIARFSQVESLFLMSGGYDLLLFVKGRNLQEVAKFVSSRLATMEGVLSTATHFMLKTYKDQGVLMENFDDDDRLKVTP